MHFCSLKSKCEDLLAATAIRLIQAQTLPQKAVVHSEQAELVAEEQACQVKVALAVPRTTRCQNV